MCTASHWSQYNRIRLTRRLREVRWGEGAVRRVPTKATRLVTRRTYKCPQGAAASHGCRLRGHAHALLWRRHMRQTDRQLVRQLAQVESRRGSRALVETHHEQALVHRRTRRGPNLVPAGVRQACRGSRPGRNTSHAEALGQARSCRGSRSAGRETCRDHRSGRQQRPHRKTSSRSKHAKGTPNTKVSFEPWPRARRTCPRSGYRLAEALVPS